jgi:hypothetical protein
VTPRAPAAEVSPAERKRRREAALAAGGAAAGGAGAAAQAQIAAAAAPASVAARATASAAIVAGLVAFLSALRARDRQWLESELAKRATPGKASSSDIAALVAEEERRGQEFAEGVVRRVTADLATILAIPDPQRRGAAVQGVLDRERGYAAQRSEAMAARAFAALERVEVRHDSPQGAFWKLDPMVAEHTAGCLVMGGKFWPWAVLDRVHPPRHPGCPCRLKSWGAAVADGDMSAGDVPNVRDAVRAASGVVMEAADGERILQELELRDALVESGLVSAEMVAKIPLAVS